MHHVARRARIRALSLAVLSFLVAADAAAGGTEWAVHDTPAQLAAGDLDGLALQDPGRLVLGPEVKQLAQVDDANLWAVASCADGTIYTGTGADGRLYRLDPGKAEPVLVKDFAEPAVQAIATDCGKKLYVATNPNGRVYELALANAAAASVVFDPEETYVWDLALDAKGSLLVATGDVGRIYRVVAGKSPEVVLDSGEAHVLRMALGPGGDLFAGTADRGYVFRVSPAGERFVVWDSPFSDVVDLAVRSDGTLDLVTTGKKEPPAAGGPGAGGRGAPGAASSSAAVTPSYSEVVVVEAKPEPHAITAAPPAAVGPAVGDREGPEPAEHEGESPTPTGAGAEGSPAGEESGAATETAPAADDAAAGSPVFDVPATGEAPTGEGRVQTMAAEAPGPVSEGSAVVRIHPDGAPERLWLTADERLHSLALFGDDVLVGSGAKGRIYRVASGEAASVLVEVGGAAVPVLRGAGKRIFAGANDAARVLEILPSHNRTATYQSAPIDAGVHARWGRMVLRAETPGESTLRLRTRSGNSREPGELWSAWRELAEGGVIQSPPARLMQYEASFTADAKGVGPTLWRVEVAYVPLNMPPEIRSVEVLAPDLILEQLPAQPMTVRPNRTGAVPQTNVMMPQSREVPMAGMRAARWDAADPNGDVLRYTVELRAESEDAWRTLATDVERTFLSWDTATIGDGKYTLRVTANDADSNSAARMKSTSKLSAPFVIDLSPPRLTTPAVTLDGREAAVRFRAEDGTSFISRAGYTVDGGPWVSLEPRDGVFDQLDEELAFAVKLAPGKHTLALSAIDRAENVATTRLLVTIDK
ncbi:MAG: PQQ-binding-like beta-propeller repeat protein [Candidatus Schekmanbacteria bacterium]|nr:PQQ-binding-like beta-propeller repeat protein [Candidatus Schekmanbacteria bacterium]